MNGDNINKTIGKHMDKTWECVFADTNIVIATESITPTYPDSIITMYLCENVYA